MTTPAARPSAPPALIDAARLRREGRLNDALEVVEAALARARATPLAVPFRDRVLLGLALSDLYLSTDQSNRARQLLVTEVAFANSILERTKQGGSPEQIRAATAGCYQLRDRAKHVELLGGPAPEIAPLDWVQGQATTLAEQRGRVVLVEFWGRTCRSCLAIIPALNDLHRRYHDEGLTVLALTRYVPGLDDPDERTRERELIAQTIVDHGSDIAVGVAPDGGLQQLYGASGIPTFVIIDRAGTVRLASSVPDKATMESTISGLLNEPFGSDS